MSHLELIAIVVEEYDPAIAFFVNSLGFELVGLDLDGGVVLSHARPRGVASRLDLVHRVLLLA